MPSQRSIISYFKKFAYLDVNAVSDALNYDEIIYKSAPADVSDVLNKGDKLITVLNRLKNIFEDKKYNIIKGLKELFPIFIEYGKAFSGGGPETGNIITEGKKVGGVALKKITGGINELV